MNGPAAAERDVIVRPGRLARRLLWVAGCVAAFAVVAVALVVAPAVLSGSPPSGAWDPATAGGFDEVGAFSYPWVPLLVFDAVLALLLAARQRALGRPFPRGWRRLTALVTTREGFALLAMGLVFGPFLQLSYPDGALDGPLRQVPPFGPGPTVSEIRGDGTWVDTSLANTDQVPPSCDDVLCPGPRYVYRVMPKETFTYLFSFTNRGSLPLTLLGVQHGPVPTPVSSVSAIGLLRDPSVVSADPSNVVAFRPVVLWPGASVSVVIAETAGVCARPAAALPPSSFDEPLAGMQAVYGMMGWRRETTVYAPFQIAVAGEDTCPLR